LPIALFVPTAPASTYVGPGGPIPDALDLKGPPGEILSEVEVTEAIVPETLSVTITGLEHTWCGDVVIRLTHLPSGATQSLVHRIGVPIDPPVNVFGDSSNFGGDYLFIDGGGDIWLAAGGGGSTFVVPPGSYHASDAGSGSAVPLLGAFAGIDASGTWRLTVQDAAAGDTGSFLSWTLSITGSPVPLCPGEGSCFEPHEGPGCEDPACCNAVCGAAPVCCEQEWDLLCAINALAICGGCGDADSGDCCVAHAGTGCDNQPCCEAVCATDPHCCTSAWDGACAEAAAALPLCACPVCPGQGDCFTPHGGIGCELVTCCEAVCDTLPECCEVGWDASCVSQALVSCTTCGSPGAGECCTPHPTPGCAVLECCAAVCEVSPLCCTSGWDLSCVALAGTFPACACPSPCEVSEGCCFTPHGNGGCNDPDCCESVCASDPGCCEQSWDAQCASVAFSLCCPADLNSDGTVDGADLGLLLESLFVPGQGGGPSDFDCNGAVDSGDLGILLSAWGDC
jgi:subtilisin-like proprotein convertase family protein